MTATAPTRASQGWRGARLRASSDVRRAFSGRRPARVGPVVAHAFDRADGGEPRLTVVAGRAVGNAVARNRVKRRLRAFAREAPAAAGFDYVIVGRAGAAQTPAPVLRDGVVQAVAAVTRR